MLWNHKEIWNHDVLLLYAQMMALSHPTIVLRVIISHNCFKSYHLSHDLTTLNVFTSMDPSSFSTLFILDFCLQIPSPWGHVIYMYDLYFLFSWKKYSFTKTRIYYIVDNFIEWCYLDPQNWYSLIQVLCNGMVYLY